MDHIGVTCSWSKYKPDFVLFLKLKFLWKSDVKIYMGEWRNKNRLGNSEDYLGAGLSLTDTKTYIQVIMVKTIGYYKSQLKQQQQQLPFSKIP